MVTQIIDISASQEQFLPKKTATASNLGPEERKNLSLQVLVEALKGQETRLLSESQFVLDEMLSELVTPFPPFVQPMGFALEIQQALRFSIMNQPFVDEDIYAEFTRPGP